MQDQEARTVHLFFKRGPDCRRYNEPTHNEMQQFLLARTEHHLQTGTLWCTPGTGHRRGCPISPVM